MNNRMPLIIEFVENGRYLELNKFEEIFHITSMISDEEFKTTTKDVKKATEEFLESRGSKNINLDKQKYIIYYVKDKNF